MHFKLYKRRLCDSSFLFQVSERKWRVANSKIPPRNSDIHVSNEPHHQWELSVSRLLEDICYRVLIIIIIIIIIIIYCNWVFTRWQ
jgi:hypothetical protein